MSDDPRVTVPDHEYFGNICSGFGAPTECEWFDMATGRRCGKSPAEHRRYAPPPVPVSDEAEVAWQAWMRETCPDISESALASWRTGVTYPAFIAGFRAARQAGKDDENA